MTFGTFGRVRPAGPGRLVGTAAPTIQLLFALEGTVSLAELARRHALAVFFHHGDAQRTRAWAEWEGELEELGCIPVAVSAQSPAVQQRFARRELLGYMLLSDSEFRLADKLGLPTVTAAGERVYEPLTLLIQEGCITQVLYPVDPAREIAEVATSIKRRFDP